MTNKKYTTRPKCPTTKNTKPKRPGQNIIDQNVQGQTSAGQIVRAPSEKHMFTFEIASNGCLHLIDIYIKYYIVECRQHKHDNQPYGTLKSRSLAISTSTILKVINLIHGEHHK